MAPGPSELLQLVVHFFDVRTSPEIMTTQEEFDTRDPNMGMAELMTRDHLNGRYRRLR